VAVETSIDWAAIGVRLREVRGETSQVDFGRLLGVPQNFVSRYEHARARPSVEYLAAVASVRNVSLDWLILGREPRRAARQSRGGSGAGG
jgi:transcriptional regulator with XRE-family HTH domain